VVLGGGLAGLKTSGFRVRDKGIKKP